MYLYVGHGPIAFRIGTEGQMPFAVIEESRHRLDLPAVSFEGGAVGD